MEFTHVRVGPAPGVVDPLKDFNLELAGQKQTLTGRRTDTLALLGLDAPAQRADQVVRQTPGASPALAVDQFVTAEEVRRLGALHPDPQRPLLEQLLERPAPQPLGLTKAERVIRREIEARYDPNWVELGELPESFRKLALRILDTFDAKTSAESLREEHPRREEGKISVAIIEAYKALSDLELYTFDPDQANITAAHRRSLANTLLRHLTAEGAARETEPQHPKPAVTRLPVTGAKINLVTTPVPDVERNGRQTYHNLNRVLEVKVEPGHTVVINVQSVGKDQLGLAEQVLKAKANGTSHELPYLPGVSKGEPAEVWITVLKGKEVVANVNYALPPNPITERIDKVYV